MKITRFPLGNIVATPAVLSHPEISKSIAALLRRHRNCDHGESVPPTDIALNQSALRSQAGRVVSSYQIEAKKLFVITDGLNGIERHTTIMFAEEY